MSTFCASTKKSTELSIHKEQLKQHSITIVNFEKEVNRLKKKETEYANKIESLEKRLKDQNVSSVSITKSATSLTQQASTASTTNTLHTTQSTSSISPQALVTETFNNESLNRTIDLLR